MKKLFILAAMLLACDLKAVTWTNINIGTSVDSGDGESRRSGGNKINQFNQQVTNEFTALEASTNATGSDISRLNSFTNTLTPGQSNLTVTIAQANAGGGTSNGVTAVQANSIAQTNTSFDFKIEQISGLVAYWSAASTNVPSGTLMTNLVDPISGRVLSLPTYGAFTAPKWLPDVYNGKPALFFNTTSNALVCSNLYVGNKALETNQTILLVGQIYQPTNEFGIFGWIGGNNIEYCLYGISQARDGSGAVGWYPGGVSTMSGPCLVSTNQPFVYAMRYGSNQNAGRIDIFDRGMLANYNNMTTLIPVTNDFVLGNRGEMYANTFANMYVYEIRIYNRVLSQSEISSLTFQYGQKYGVINPVQEVVLDGDSINYGSSGSTNHGPVVLLQRLLPAYSAYDVAQSGRQISDRISNLTNWSANAQSSIVLAPSMASDILASASQTSMQQGYSNYCAAIRSRGQRVIVSSPTSLYPTAGTGGAGPAESNRVFFASWVRGNWKTFADGFVDYGAIPQIGAYAAASNNIGTYFETDGLHPLGAAYDIMVPMASQEVLRVASQTNFTQQIKTGIVPLRPCVGTISISSSIATGTETHFSNDIPVGSKVFSTNSGYGLVTKITSDTSATIMDLGNMNLGLNWSAGSLFSNAQPQFVTSHQDNNTVTAMLDGNAFLTQTGGGNAGGAGVLLSGGQNNSIILVGPNDQLWGIFPDTSTGFPTIDFKDITDNSYPLIIGANTSGYPQNRIGSGGSNVVDIPQWFNQPVYANGITNKGVPVPIIQAGSTNATAATSLIIQFKYTMPTTNYTVGLQGNGVTIPAMFVTAKTTSGFTANFTIFTGLIDWVVTQMTQ